MHIGLYPVYTRSKNGSRTVLRVDVNADGSVPNRSVPPITGPPRGGSLHRSITVHSIVIGGVSNFEPTCVIFTPTSRSRCVYTMPRKSSDGSWSDREVMLFIELWGEDSVQTQLEGAKHNKPVYERIAAELAKSGSNKTAEQCNSKIKKLKLKYRKECDKHNKTGSKWRFFDALDGILSHRPTSQPTVLLDTSASAPSTNDSDIDSQEEGDNDQEESPSVSGEPVESNEEIHTSTGAEMDLEQPSTSKNPIIKGKRKRSKEDKLESIMSSVVKEVVTAQQESDKIFPAHEEKRMKFEAEQ